MDESKKSGLSNSFLAVVGGIVGTVLAALILYPLEMIVFDHFLDFDFFEESNITTFNDSVLTLSFIVWYFLAAIVGGIICSFISKANEYRHTWILISLVLIIKIYDSIIHNESAKEIIVLLVFIISIITAFLLGARIGIGIKIKRDQRKAKLKDTEPSPSDTPLQ